MKRNEKLEKKIQANMNTPKVAAILLACLYELELGIWI